MWLAIKLAAGKAKMPPSKIIHDTLGEEHARRYKTLARDFPEVERGPDEDLINHYTRLNKAFEEENAQADENPELLEQMKGRRPQAPPAEPASSPFIRGKDEIEHERMMEQFTPADLKGMPQRNPGAFTGDTMMNPGKPLPGHTVPPMERRTPGRFYDPHYEPPRPSRDEWVRGLADKGIYLNPDGSRMTPKQMELPQRPLRGQQIWDQFTRPAPYGGRHRAAKVVVAYVTRALAGAHDAMIADGWQIKGNNGQPGPLGSGAWYQKNIGDRTHVIVRDSDGWIHNHGPADAEPNEYGDPEVDQTPMFFDSLGDAVMHAKRGTHQVGFSVKPKVIEDSSYHPERTEGTRPIGNMLPPDVKGKYQTLSRSWREA